MKTIDEVYEFIECLKNPYDIYNFNGAYNGFEKAKEIILDELDKPDDEQMDIYDYVDENGDVDWFRPEDWHSKDSRAVKGAE